MISLPKVTVITVVRNGREFIRDCVESVLAQAHPDIEYIVKDAGSTDGTLDILAEYGNRLKVISSPDTGMYDGLNQALAAATGNIVATLNSDDMYTTPKAVAGMVAKMEESGADMGWGDLVIVDRADVSRVVRRWTAGAYIPGKLRWGWHPPHPSTFVRRSAYGKYGAFRTDMRISADYELMLRMLGRHHIASCYLPETLVTMRAGGASNRPLAVLWKSRVEDARAWRVNGMGGGWFTALVKPFSKLLQLI